MVQNLKTIARRHLLDRQTDANNSGADGERKMVNFQGGTIRTRDDLKRFESEMTLDERLPERSILDVFQSQRCTVSNLHCDNHAYDRSAGRTAAPGKL